MKLFKWIALLEGLSFIVLIFGGVPLKYLFDNPVLVKTFGMPHGILFMAYIFTAFYLKNTSGWNNKQMFIILLASIIPFGTFYIDKKYLQNLSKIKA